MRISQIVASLDPRSGGPSVSVPGLSGALARLGHDVTLFSTTSPGEKPGPPTVDGVTRQLAPRTFPASLAWAPGLEKMLAAVPADLVHAHALWQRPLHDAHQRAIAAGVPLVVSPRGMMSAWAWRHHRWKKWLAQHFVHSGALAGATGWHATSQEEANDIRALGFRQPICLAPNGVVVPDAAASDTARTYWRQACPACVGRPTALFYSRLHSKKRIVELIELWLDVAPRDWLLLVVGIPEEFSVAQLQAHVQARQGAERVEVFDGTRAPAPYAVAQLFLLPSHSENFGMVIAEALVHGVPALVTDTTPWQPLPQLGLGWCCAWSDYARCLREALALTPEALRARGQASQDWAAREYDWSRTARLLVDFYTELRASHAG